MAPARKCRAPIHALAEDEDESSMHTPRRHRPASEEPEADGEYADWQDTQSASSSQAQLVKKMVRLALACEYSRTPIRRTEISQKVLGANSRQFRPVFEQAQRELEYVFGMRMVELPMREKVTIQQRRAAQKSEKQSVNSNKWIVVSTLPPKLRNPDIIAPPKVPTVETESAYIGLYTFVVSLIYISGGVLPEAKLERYLKRTNTDHSTPVDSTDKLLKRMEKEEYIVKHRDPNSGDEVVEYMVGPRGKMEIGEEGVAGVVRSVYGQGNMADLERRIERSLGVNGSQGTQMPNGTAATQGERRGPGRPRKQTQEDRDEQATDDDEDDEE